MRLLIGGTVAAITLAAASAAAAAPSGTLYVAQAGQAQLQRSGAGWRLVLSHPTPQVTTFADRPVRTGGTQTLRRFVSAWRDEFGTDAPNAALELSGAPASRDVALLELSAPAYDARADRVTFRVKPLRSTASTGLAGLAKRADGGVKGRLGRATLFVDDGAATTGLLSVTASNLTAGQFLQIGIGQPAVSFVSPPAPVYSASLNASWTADAQLLQLACSATGTQTCSGTALIAVDAPTDQPLTVMAIPLTGDQLSMSWSGGPSQSVAAPGAQVTLPNG